MLTCSFAGKKHWTDKNRMFFFFYLKNKTRQKAKHKNKAFKLSAGRLTLPGKMGNGYCLTEKTQGLLIQCGISLREN